MRRRQTSEIERETALGKGVSWLGRIFLAGLALLAGQATQAASTESAPLSSSISIAVPRSAPIEPRKFEDTSEYSLGVSRENFMSGRDAVNGSSGFTRLDLRLRDVFQGDWLAAGFDFGATTAVGIKSETMAEVPELYARLNLIKSEAGAERASAITVGRKLETWSELDSLWDIGLWQPLNRFDTLRATEQGLFGVFPEYRQGSLRVLLFASPFFLPDQGPTFDLNDGEFTSSNPWFTPPADKLLLFAKETDVKYTLVRPSVASVVNRASVGGMLAYGIGESGFFARLAYVKKPRNQLALPFTAKHVTTVASQSESVTIYPEVVTHNLISADTGWQLRSARVGLSALVDISDPQDFDLTRTSQRLKPLTMISPHIEFRALPMRAWGPRMRVAILHSIGGEIEIVGPSDAGGSAFGTRTQYRDAVSVELHSRVLNRHGWALEPKARWIEEFYEHGSLLTGEISIVTPDRWRASFFADLLATRQAPDVNVGFISRFRGNDRFGARLAYNF